MSRRDRTKVARYEVPGKAGIGEPSRRVRSDGLRFRIYNLAKGGCVDPKKIRADEGAVTVSTTNHTVPYGTELVSRGYQALRTWLPSLVPSGQQSVTTCPHFRSHIARRSCCFGGATLPNDPSVGAKRLVMPSQSYRYALDPADLSDVAWVLG